MLGELFAKILHMSLIGCWSTAIVLCIRLFLLRCGRKYVYYLWLAVFANLCIPFSFSSSLSLIPRQVTEFSVGEEITEPLYEYEESDQEAAARQTPEVKVYAGGGEAPAYEEKEPVLRRRPLELAWLAGMLLLTIHGLIGAVQLNRRLAGCVPVSEDRRERIRALPGLQTPFLWGLFRPVIYLPADLEPEERTYIIAHEKCHRRRGDHLVKLAVYAVTILHWFNPAVWLAYSLCCRDMEISCDEEVLARAQKNIRKQYAASLLKYAARQNGYRMLPLTFGEPSVKSRIQNVLKYRKKPLALTMLGMLCAVLAACGLAARPQKEEPPKRQPAKQQEEAEAAMPGQPDAALEETAAAEVENNGGTIIRAGKTLCYMSGKQLYSDGTYLYANQSSEEGEGVYQYELDGSGFRKIADGKIVGCGEDGSLYTVRQGEDGGIFEQLYVQEGRTVGNLLGGSFVETEINGFYGDEEHLVFAAGQYEGSAGLFTGDFYSYDRQTGVMRQEHLTDADTLHVVDGWVYYRKYRNQDSSYPRLYRARLDLTGEEPVGEGLLEFLAFDKGSRTIVVSKKGSEDGSGADSIVRVQPDGSREELLLDGKALGWELEPGDKLTYPEVNLVDGMIFVKAQQYGYREGLSIGWRDALIQEQYFFMGMDGSSPTVWTPQEFGEEPETFDLDAHQVGYACDPVGKGWNLTEITDVRESFARMSYVPEPGTEDDTYLLGETAHYTLYGKGDFESMLLKCGEKYAEIQYPYASNYMIPLELLEADFDGDGSAELAVRFNIKHGTGVYIDTFFMADQGDGKLAVYQFQEKEIAAQLAEHVSWERTETGIQPLVDGQKAGRVIEDRGDGMEDWSYVSVGSQIRFSYEDGEVWVRADLEGWASDSVIPDYNEQAVAARLVYENGGYFGLKDFGMQSNGLE